MAIRHFFLSAAARSISLKAVYKMGEDKAYETFRKLRWPETDGEAVCPECGCTETYNITSRRRFKCVACHKQFSVTSGTIFASRKLAFTDLLAAIVIFVNGAKGISALQLGLDLATEREVSEILMAMESLGTGDLVELLKTARSLALIKTIRLMFFPQGSQQL